MNLKVRSLKVPRTGYCDRGKSFEQWPFFVDFIDDNSVIDF